MDILTNLSWEPWLALGLALLAAEALGASGFLIGAAVAALANAVLVWLFPSLSVTAQFIIYAISALVATYAYFQLFRDAQRSDDAPPINERAASLIGKQVTLEEDLADEGRVQIGDTMWKVAAESPLKAGTQVVVTGTDGMTLQVRARS